MILAFLFFASILTASSLPYNPSSDASDGQQSCNYVQEPFSLPLAVPSCAWVSTQSSRKYECVNSTTVKKTTYNAIGCTEGLGEIQSETFIFNDDSNIVDCSNQGTCFASNIIAAAAPNQEQCSRRNEHLTTPLSDQKSREDVVTGVCFGVFGDSPRLKYSCHRGLILDTFEPGSGAGCDSTVFYRSVTRSCHPISASHTNFWSCSRPSSRPPRFSRPYLRRKSSQTCGSLADATVWYQLKSCYARSFTLPVEHACSTGRDMHVETTFAGDDCDVAGGATVVAQVKIPTGRCINGKFKEKCKGRIHSLGYSEEISDSEAIVGTVYSSATCDGVGVGVRYKKDFEFTASWTTVQFVCDGQVKEMVGGSIGATFNVGSCVSLVQTAQIGKTASGVSLGTHVRFEACPV